MPPNSYQHQKLFVQYPVKKEGIHASSLLLLTLYTIDQNTAKPATIGRVVFPLFINDQTREPYLARDRESGQDFKLVLHKGKYKLPIVTALNDHKDQATYLDWIENERIPTSSVYISITKPRVGSDRIPPFDHHDYNTMYYLSTP